MSSIHSQRNLDGSVSQHGSGMNQHSVSQGLHGQLSQGGGTENASRVYSADQLDQQANPQPQTKTIISYLNDKITTFLMSGKDPEMEKIRIDGDLVTAFFDSVDKISDSMLFSFIEEMKKDIDLIMQILYASTNEMIVFFTYLLMMLKKLSPVDHSFTNTIQMCKNMAKEINIDAGDHPTSNTQMAIQQFQKDFNKYFMNHLLRNYCSIIRESAPKRQYICELIYHHCQHDL